MRLANFLSLLAVPATWAASMPESLVSVKATGAVQNPKMDKSQYVPNTQKPRTFVMANIPNEADDQQSVVRNLLYSNGFNARGLCAITSTWLRNRAHPGAIRKIVNAYGEAVDSLTKHVHLMNRYTPVEHASRSHAFPHY
ncbi:Fc.00g048450.m01.CDS01 [Cosmosporella sp. VM-42]